MPITDIGSYVTTGSEFESHWAGVDADRVANSLAVFALPDGFALTDLSADVAAVAAAITAQESLENALTIGTSGRDAQRAALRDRLIDFRKQVDYRLKGSVYVTSLPDTPLPGASEQKTLRALDDMADLWSRINADTSTPNFTPPLVFSDGYALAAMQTELAALRVQYKAVVDAENDARIGRKQRDILLQRLRDRFVSYRQGIEVEYGDQHAFTQSLPAVYSQPGSTPDAVVLSGQWDVGLGQATLSWTASTAGNLAEYEVRMSQGSTYDSAAATVVGNVQPGSQQFQTTAGLVSPGDVASFKVFVKLTTGNEKGSNTVTVTNPSGGGSTPAPVSLSGSWNAALFVADFTWNSSSSPDVINYIMRKTIGGAYDDQSATDVITLPPTATSMSTQDGLPTPGSIASFKLFTVVTGGAEAGSNAVTIQRV